MRPLNIVYVIDRYYSPHGGTESQLLMLIQGMRDRGHRVQLFVLRHTDFTRAPHSFPCNISSLEVHSAIAASSIASMLRFRKTMRHAKPDAIHVFFNDAAVLVPLYCALAGIPIITSRRDMGFWYTTRTLFSLRLANQFVNRIVCNCAAVAREVERREHAPEKKLRVIHNGLKFTTPPTHQHGLSPAKAIKICLVANIRPIKRIEDFIRAAAVVSASVTNIEYLVIGEPSAEDYSDELVALATNLGLGERIRFTGSVEDPVPLVKDCQIGVLTSASEGLSNSLLEYMSCGLAVVCSNVGGNNEIVEHGRNGFLYPVGDVELLAAHILSLCTDSSLRDLMRAESLRRTEQFSSDRMIAAHVELYLETSAQSRTLRVSA